MASKFYKVFIVIFLFNTFFSRNSIAALEENMIIEYFKMKYVHQIIVFSCEDKNEYIDLSISLMANNFYITLLNLKTMNYEIISKIHSEKHHLGFVIDADCENADIALTKCGNQILFDDKYNWLIFGTNNQVLNILGKLNLYVNAEIIVASSAPEKTNWQLLDVYNPGFNKGGSLKITNFGIWSPLSGFKINKTMLSPKYIRRKDLSELSLSGMSVLVNPEPENLMDYLYNNDSNKGLDNFSRYYFLLFDHIKDIHNFTLTVNLTKLYGSINKTGSFSGLVGAMQRKEIDVGLTPIYYKVDRVPFVDFVIPTYLMKTRFIFRHPKLPLTIRGAFFSPLSSIVWMCTWGVMAITAIIIRISFKYEYQLERQKNDNIYTEHDWSYIGLLIFGGICQQDVPQVPNLYSGRTIVFTSVFFTYMLYQFYSGGIVSSLLSEPPRNINDLKDLLHSTLEVGVEDIVYERDYLDQTNDPVAIELYKTKMVGKKNGSDAYYDLKTAMGYVKKGGFAFQCDTSGAYEIMNDEFTNEILCELGEVLLYPNQYMTGVIQQNSPFKEILVYSAQRMVEAGIVHGQRMRWTTRKPECIKIVDSSTIFAGFNEFFPALLFYIIGIVITITIFVIEIWVHHRTFRQIVKVNTRKKIFPFIFKTQKFWKK